MKANVSVPVIFNFCDCKNLKRYLLLNFAAAGVRVGAPRRCQQSIKGSGDITCGEYVYKHLFVRMNHSCQH